MATENSERRDAAAPRSRRKEWAERAALVAILFAPSAWMLAVIPPLWRDVDAYIQVTSPWGMATILHFPPLYCFLARIPLFLGYALEASRAGSALPSLGFFQTPILSHTGVFLLVLLQHLALLAPSYWLIVLASRTRLIRFSIAALWALNPLFYTFMHCVGSESLSVLLILFLAAAGFMLVRRWPCAWRRDWLVCGALLVLCILTRHVNAILAALLPIAFLLSAKRADIGGTLRAVGLAIVLGLIAVGLANATLRLLCHTVHMPYYSRVGYTFLFRLRFLADLTPDKKNQVLDELAQKTRSPEVRAFLEILRAQSPTPTDKWPILEIFEKVGTLIGEQDPSLAEMKTSLLYNDGAKAFLFPPHPASSRDARRNSSCC